MIIRNSLSRRQVLQTMGRGTAAFTTRGFFAAASLCILVKTLGESVFTQTAEVC